MQNSRLQKFNIYYNNSEEYHHLKREVFTSDLYYFETDNPTPFIIDAGAHIGLSTLYFKQLYPGAEIISIEPNPSTFKILETNLFENQIDNVTTINSAVSNVQGKESFFLDETYEEWHSTASFHKGSWVGSQKSEEIVVSTIKLSSLITKTVDFLKIDIEGAEQKVLKEVEPKLPLVKEIQVEFHTHPTQSLKKVIDILERTHKIELYKGTTIIPTKMINKTKGLVQIRAVNRKNK
jgi:FkbM family methyltransferase